MEKGVNIALHRLPCAWGVLVVSENQSDLLIGGQIYIHLDENWQLHAINKSSCPLSIEYYVQIILRKLHKLSFILGPLAPLFIFWFGWT